MKARSDKGRAFLFVEYLTLSIVNNMTLCKKSDTIVHSS